MRKFRSVYLDKMKEKDDKAAKARAKRASLKNSFRCSNGQVVFG